MLKMNRIIADKDIIVNKQPKLKPESSFDIDMMFSQNYNVLDKSRRENQKTGIKGKMNRGEQYAAWGKGKRLKKRGEKRLREMREEAGRRRESRRGVASRDYRRR